MSEDFGPTFITVTDEDGNEIVLEFIDALEHNGQMYQDVTVNEIVRLNK